MNDWNPKTIALFAISLVVTGLVTWMLAKGQATYDAGAQAEIGNAPAVVALKEEVAELTDEVNDLKTQLAASTAEGKAERAALANQSNKILEAILSN